MKLSNWIRFTWDLTQLPAFENALPEHYEIGPATADSGAAIGLGLVDRLFARNWPGDGPWDS